MRFPTSVCQAIIFRAKHVFKNVDLMAPELACAIQPIVELTKSSEVERLNSDRSLGPPRDDRSLAQHVQMQRNRRCTHVEFDHKLARGAIALCQQLNDATSGRIGDGKETLHGRY